MELTMCQSDQFFPCLLVYKCCLHYLFYIYHSNKMKYISMKFNI